ncbi:MAG: universal stress protein [Rhodoglobus sp.]
MKSTTALPIVVGVDGSDASLAALHQGVRLSKALDLPLRIVTSWSHPTTLDGGYAMNGWSPERDAREILSMTLEKAFHGDPPPHLTSAAIEGLPVRVLLDESKRAEMLVLGSRGHGGFVGMLMGSVSSACAQHAHCPVLIVRDGDS